MSEDVKVIIEAHRLRKRAALRSLLNGSSAPRARQEGILRSIFVSAVLGGLSLAIFYAVTKLVAIL